MWEKGTRFHKQKDFRFFQLLCYSSGKCWIEEEESVLSTLNAHHRMLLWCPQDGERAGPRRETGTAPPVVGYMECSGDTTEFKCQTGGFMALLDLDSGSCSIFLLTWGVGGADTLQVKIDRICQAKRCIFKHYWTAFFRTDCFFPIDIFLSGGAKTSSDAGRFGSTIQGDCWFWRPSGRGYPMNGFGEVWALWGLKTEHAWLEITNWVWIFIILQCQKL